MHQPPAVKKETHCNSVQRNERWVGNATQERRGCREGREKGFEGPAQCTPGKTVCSRTKKDIVTLL